MRLKNLVSMKTIISLTTISSRIDSLRFVLYALTNQSLMPDVIYVNISSESYMSDDGIKKIPEWAEEFTKKAVVFNFVENIGPYRKLNPILEIIGEDDLLIVCDDDVIYGHQWLESLVGSAKANPNSIVCARARMITKGIFGRTKSYIFWNHAVENNSQEELLPVGAGGVVYRKRLIDFEFIKNKVFKRIAPLQDDLWYRHASLITGVPVYVCTNAWNNVYPLLLPEGLYLSNTTTFSANDSVLSRFLKTKMRYVMGYLGFSVTKNDFVWKDICKYRQRGVW